MKIARLVTLAALVASLVACASSEPPDGCVDTAPKVIKGKVLEKAEGQPRFDTVEGQGCYSIRVEDSTGESYWIYVSKEKFRQTDPGHLFERDLTKVTK